MIRNLKIILSISIVGLIGPLGIILSFFRIGMQGAYQGKRDFVVLDEFFLSNFFVNSITFNLIVCGLIAYMVYLIRGKSISFINILDKVLYSHLFFIPILIFVWIHTQYPVEGNVMGFLFLPLFLLFSAVGVIGFWILLNRKLRKHVATEASTATKKLRQPYVVAGVILVLLQIAVNWQMKVDEELYSFDHGNFSWNIMGAKFSRFGSISPVRNEVLDFIIHYDNDDRKDSYKLTLNKSHHSLYTGVPLAISVNQDIRRLAETNDPELLRNSWNIKKLIVTENPDSSIYRIKERGYSLYLDPNRSDEEMIRLIASDLYSIDINELLQSKLDRVVLEAVVLGNIESATQTFKNSNGESLEVTFNGEISQGEFWSSIGQIWEGTIYTSEDLDMSLSDVWNDYKNSEGKSFADIYKLIDNYACRTHIDVAIKDCPDMEELRLENSGRVPDSICELQKLKWIRITDSKIDHLPDCLSSLQYLTAVELSNCRFTDIPEAISGIPNLETLDLTGNKITQIPEEWAPNLLRLILTGNKIAQIPEELGQISSLEKLFIDYVPNMIIPMSLVNKERFTLIFNTYNTDDTKEAKKLIMKLGKRDSFEDKNEWGVDELLTTTDKMN